jgi:hypothetical protein
MRKLNFNFVLAALISTLFLSAQAVVKPGTLVGEFFEGKNISIKGKNIKTNVTLTTVDNQTFELTGTTNKKKTRLTLQLPLISDDAKVKLTFTDKDGSVTINTVIYNDPTLANGGVDLFENPVILPDTIDSGIAGAPGPEGPEGPAGPEGPPGAPGSIPPTYPGNNVTGVVNLANTVVQATQPNITSLPALANVGTSTTFTGTVTAAGFIGPVTGNVTGNADTATDFTGALAGDVTGTQGATVLQESALFAKTVQAGFVANAGLVNVGDTLEVALEKLDGVGQVNSTAILNNVTNITTNATAIGTPTAANTANEIVKRDGSGNFAAGTITANLTGNVTGDVTGNVTGNSDTATNFTGALAGDITGTQAATVLAPSVLFAKQLEAGYASTTGAIAAGTSLLDAVQILDGNIKDTVQKTGSNATAIGAINATITNIQTDITNAENDITALDTRVTTNETDIATNATAAATAQTAADDAQADVDALSSVAAVDLEGVTTFAVASAVVTLDDSNAGTVEDLDTITGASAGQRLIIVFEETITVSNDDAGTADTINLDGAVDVTFNANDTLELVYVNGSWYQVSSSDN